jgi:hypothetical protein
VRGLIKEKKDVLVEELDTINRRAVVQRFCGI